MKYVAFVFAVMLTACAQSKAPTLTLQEKLDIRQAQNEILRANDALQKSAEYQKTINAQAQLNKVGTAVYTSRKLKFDDYSLCDGPGPAPCENVPAGDIVLRPRPKQDAKK